MIPVPLLLDDLTWIPAWEDIPEEFREWCSTKWHKLQSDWFYSGVTITAVEPKPGVDIVAAIRAIAEIQSLRALKHEHKEAVVAYLFSEWFEDITWTVNEKRQVASVAEQIDAPTPCAHCGKVISYDDAKACARCQQPLCSRDCLPLTSTSCKIFNPEDEAS